MWLAVIATGCQWLGGGEKGSGTPKTEPRQVPAFAKVELSGAFHADITASAPQAVEISGDDNLVPLVTTDVTGDVLHIDTSKRVRPKLDLVAKLATPALAAVSVSGSSQLELRGVSGDAFRLEVSGSAQGKAAGATHKLSIHVSGAGSIDASALAAEDVTVNITGSGDLDVSASGVLDVSISGAGHVRYHGTPREVKKSISGSGSVEQK